MKRKVFTINMNEKTQCAISFASKGREDYNRALARNIVETKKHFKGDLLYYSLDNPTTVEGIEIKGGLPKDCPTHQEVPYGFKPYLFKEAFDLGYRQILWMDSTIVMVKNPEPIFEHARRKGIAAFHNLGHDLMPWISDKAAKNIGLDLYQEPYQIMACVIAFDLNHPEGKEIFDEWFALCNDGESFQNGPGSWPTFKAHRHDQACLSGILWKRQIKLLPYGTLVYQPHDTTFEHGKDFYFVNKAI